MPPGGEPPQGSIYKVTSATENSPFASTECDLRHQKFSRAAGWWSRNGVLVILSILEYGNPLILLYVYSHHSGLVGGVEGKSVD